MRNNLGENSRQILKFSHKNKIKIDQIRQCLNHFLTLCLLQTMFEPLPDLMSATDND